MARLDKDLWQRSELGTVGPTGLISFFLNSDNSGARVVYASLDDAFIAPPDLMGFSGDEFEVVQGMNSDLPAKAIKDLQLDSGRHRKEELERWNQVILKWPRTSARAAFCIYRESPFDSRLSELLYFWADRSRGQDGEFLRLSALWRYWSHLLVRSGFVAMFAKIPDEGLHTLVVKLGLFKTLTQALQENGVLDEEGQFIQSS